MFDELLLVLSKVHVSYLLLGNYTFGGLRSNAVLITSKEIRLFIFKDYFSEITPSKKDVWTTSDGKIIEGGLGAISPYKQAHIYKELGEKWFGKILQRNPKIKVTEFSDLYPNKGTKKFYRAYVEVNKSNVAES